MTAMNQPEFKVIAEDLDFLSDRWREGLSDENVRRGSVVLRLLLCEPILVQAATHFRLKKPRILAGRPISPENFPLRDDCTFLWPGGSTFEAGYLKSIADFDRSIPINELRPLSRALEEAEGVNEPVPIERFLKHLAFYYKGAWITKGDVIKYVCHVAGGAHLDPKRELPQSLSDATGEQLYSSLDTIRASVQFNGRDPVMTEMLCIGQAVVRSKDIIALRAEIRRAFEV